MEQGYRIKYTYSSRDDMRKMKKYILETFKYRELGEKFSKKMKAAAKDLKTLPTGYDIYLKPYSTYLFFYIVDEITQTVTVLRVMQDGMNWKFILKRWLQENK